MIPLNDELNNLLAWIKMALVQIVCWPLWMNT